jgi:hypothetical protein
MHIFTADAKNAEEYYILIGVERTPMRKPSLLRSRL